MHIYLWTTLTIRFLEVGSGRGAGWFLAVSLVFSAGPVLKVNFYHRDLRSSTVAFLEMQP
jgi:hypothetical protein